MKNFQKLDSGLNFFDVPSCPSTQELFLIPPAIFFIATFRSDLSSLNLSNLTDRISLYDWWVTAGAYTYFDCSWEIGEQEVEYLNSIDLIDAFKNDFGNLGFLLKNYYSIKNLNDVLIPYLNGEIESSLDPKIRIPRFLPLLISSREDLKELFDLSTFHGLLAAIKWWETGGRDDVPSLAWNIGHSFLLLNEEIESSLDPKIRIPRFLPLLISSRVDLKKLFNLSTFDGLVAAIKWWDSDGHNEYLNLRWNSGRSIDIATKLKRAPIILNKGVDVVGYGQGALGVGEDARMAYLSLEAAGVLANLVSPPIAGPKKYISTKNYKFNNNQTQSISIFTLPPQEMMRMVTEGGRYFFSHELYKIGAWPWELSSLPEPLKFSELLVNEVWAQSSYVYEAFSASLNVPIILMPMAVSIPKVSENLIRSKYNLQNNSFIFFTVFDGNSWLKRKNPVAAVKAFQKAFPKNQKDVSLVIKSMNVTNTQEDWIKILKIAESDSRILIVNEIFSKQDLVDFMSLCDAFVSLHRSEGFGRSIAEAMLLGKPVITSNYSGNLDFCNQENSYLVDGEIILLGKNDYPYGDMQHWFDPDVTSAASQMRKVFDDHEGRLCKSEMAKNNIVKNYSVQAISKQYKEHIGKILSRL